jgi:hypothetical protein
MNSGPPELLTPVTNWRRVTNGALVWEVSIFCFFSSRFLHSLFLVLTHFAFSVSHSREYFLTVKLTCFYFILSRRFFRDGCQENMTV